MKIIRSMLFLPGNKPNILIHGDELLADAIIFDLEDSVSISEKDAARILVRNMIKDYRPISSEIIVRVNAIETEFFKKDLREIIPLKPFMIMPPKVSSKEMVNDIDAQISEIEKETNIEVGSTNLICLLETAKGIENAYEIATASKRVKALFLGGEDLTSDLECKRTKEGNEIDYARKRIVLAAKAASVFVYDTPFTDVNDDEGIIQDAKYAASLGFSGKSSIAPRHIPFINEVFSPTIEEIKYAYDVLNIIEEAKKKGQGVVALNGKMIDAPVVSRAKKVISMAESIGLNKNIINDSEGL
ncbi:MAG: CoA ester lyase [Eubacteriales bacterium]|nr:CoA ester lyase [Eubacteriales bacterium]